MKQREMQHLTCFLSSAVKDSSIAEEVHGTLVELGVDVRTAEDLAAGSNVAASIVDAVLSADFVCVVLGDDHNNPAVWYEAGIAAGSRRPAVLVAESKAIDQLPFNLFSTPIVRYSPHAPKILRDNLTAYIRQVQPIAAQLKVSWDEGAATESMGVIVNQGSEAMTSEGDLRAELVQHFMSQGIMTGDYRQVGPKETVDALISFPALGDEFNTVIVEVKRSRANEQRDINQALELIRAAGARLGLVVYSGRILLVVATVAFSEVRCEEAGSSGAVS